VSDILPCPYCRSARIRLLDARITIRIVPWPEGGPGREKKCQVYRCLDCGREFDEVEAEESRDEKAEGSGFD
jgi:hypothetical protein